MTYPFYPCIGPDENLLDRVVTGDEPQERQPEPTAEAEERAEDFWNERGMSEMLFKRFPVEVREPKDAKEFLFGINTQTKREGRYTD